MSLATPYRALLALTALTAVPSCDDSAPPDEVDPADIVVAERAAASLQATINLAHIGNVYRAPAIHLDLSPQQVQALAVWGLQVSLERVYSAFGCEPMIESDDQSFVAATFVDCSTPFLEIAGRASANIEVRSEPCDAGQCPTAIVWTVDGSDFRARNPRQEFGNSFIGIVKLTTPLVEGVAMEWETDPRFEIELPLGRFYARSHASWLIDDDSCVTMDLEAQLTQIEPGDDLDEAIGDIVVSAQGLKQCEDRCPTAGAVNLLYGAGELLQWTYEGGETIVATGPGARQFDVGLTCIP